MNDIGYLCDPIVVDASWFVPQSRQRLFVVCSQIRIADAPEYGTPLRPALLRKALDGYSDLRLQGLAGSVAEAVDGLASVVERLAPDDARWWDPDRVARFVASLSPLQLARLDELRASPDIAWRTAYRRTRDGKAVWEIRADDVAGALRTARGGSSKQALVETGASDLRLRWMTPREYARLQGAPTFDLDSVTTSQALYALGDAVCVPAISWIARAHLRRYLSETTGAAEKTA
jgi:DNA (cytosine-5)-methyltransferase 1